MTKPHRHVRRSLFHLTICIATFGPSRTRNILSDAFSPPNVFLQKPVSPHRRHATILRSERRDGIRESSDPSTGRRRWISTVVGTAAVSAFGLSGPANASTAISEPVALKSASALCDPTISTWKRNSRVVHILGTAHISADSASLAGRLVRETVPDAVFVELDEKRVKKGGLPEGRTVDELGGGGGSDVTPGSSPVNKQEKTEVFTASTDSSEPVKKKPRFRNPFDLRNLGSALVGGAIKKLYSKLESQGFSAGEEFVVAVREGLAVNATIVLGDRDVDVTLSHIADAIGKTDLNKLLSADSEFEAKLESDMPSEVREKMEQLRERDASEAEQLTVMMEQLKTKETVKKLMRNLEESAPQLYKALVSERDEYMASGLDGLGKFDKIVAVMGIAHVDGVERYLSERGWVNVQIACPR